MKRKCARFAALPAAAITALIFAVPAFAAGGVENKIMEKPLALEANGTSVSAVVSWPETGTAEWGVVIVPGSFANDVDGNYFMEQGNPFAAKPHMYRDLAQQLAARGVAALRYARSGAKVVDREIAAQPRHFSGRTAVVAEAVKALRASVPGLRHVALAGHSEGGPVSLLLLTQDKSARVDAYISLSAPARRIFDILLQQAAMGAKDGVASFGPMKYPLSVYNEAMELARADKPVPPEILKQLPPFGVYAMDEPSKRYLREYDAVDSKALIAEFGGPVLIVQGGMDTSVFPDNADMLMDARGANPAPTKKAFFPELQHFYKVQAPGLDPLRSFNLETESDPRVAVAIAEWLAALPGAPRK